MVLVFTTKTLIILCRPPPLGGGVTRIMIKGPQKYNLSEKNQDALAFF